MTDLTLSQRTLRPVVNFLVERFFPQGAFFGYDLADRFKDADGHFGVVGSGAAMYLQRIMRRGGNDTMHIDMHEITDNGEPVGSYRLTLEKIHSEEGQADD